MCLLLRNSDPVSVQNEPFGHLALALCVMMGVDDLSLLLFSHRWWAMLLTRWRTICRPLTMRQSTPCWIRSALPTGKHSEMHSFRDWKL